MRKQPKWPIFFIALFPVLLVGIFLYKYVLPYQFSPQWQPTPENINKTGAYDHVHEDGMFLGKAVRSQEVSYDPSENGKVLGDQTEPKRIEVDLANQRVYAYEGQKKVMEFLVSTGKWGRTPTGTFTIFYKNRAQRMKGGNAALGTFYDLPNVQFVQFFGNSEIPWSRGFSFHGAYWHNNFGHPMSHGCVNMRNEDAEALYSWTSPEVGKSWFARATTATPGTKVIIYGEAPAS